MPFQQPSQPDPADLTLAERTVNRFGLRLRALQYKRHRLSHERKAIVAQERKNERAIKVTVARIQRELDAHPGLYRQLGLERDED